MPEDIKKKIQQLGKRPPLPVKTGVFLPNAIVPPHEQTKVGVAPEARDPKKQLADAQARARAVNESIRDSRTELLSEPASSAPTWTEEPVTAPESPQGRLSLADFEAFQSWQRARNAPVEPTPPQSIAPKRSLSPASGTRRWEVSVEPGTRDWLFRILFLLCGGGLVGGAVAVKGAVDAPKEEARAWESKAARDARISALETRLDEEGKQRFKYDEAMTAWLSAVLPPLGVKVVYDTTAPPPEPVPLLPAPTLDPNRVRGKQAPPVQPTPIPVPVPPQ